MLLDVGASNRKKKYIGRSWSYLHSLQVIEPVHPGNKMKCAEHYGPWIFVQVQSYSVQSASFLANQIIFPLIFTQLATTGK